MNYMISILIIEVYLVRNDFIFETDSMFTICEQG